MKKISVIFLSLIMVLTISMLTACGGSSGGGDTADSPYLGTWVSANISLGEESGELDEQMSITLNGDGTGVMSSSEGDEDFTWSPTSDGFKTSGDFKATFKEEEGGLVTKIIGVELHFVRADEAASSEGEADLTDPVNGAIYGYSGDDPVQAAVYQYLVEQVAPNYDMPEGAVSIPIVQLVNEELDTDDGDAEVKGDFWILNYVIEGDTLKMVSGGNHPGKMELIEVGSGYTVKEFEQVQDGGNFESSAKEIFEEQYDMFMNVNGDQESRESLRAQIMADYVKANGLSVTKYQDEGWDPVDIPL